METRLTVSADCRSSKRPTSVDPVKLIFLTTSLWVSCAQIARASPVTTLNTPDGIPASEASAAKARAEYGVSSAGRQIMVQPAASAAAALRAIIAEGKFQGVMAAQTPTGSRITKHFALGKCAGR